MKRILFFLVPAIFVASCSGNSESSIVEKVDTSRVMTFDTSSADAFINSFIENRKAAHLTDFEITGNCILENGFFRIVNFVETIGNYSYEYCIVMNPKEKVLLENPDKDTYIEVQQILIDNNFNVSLYQGNLAPIYYDLKGDGSEDYQLSLDEGYHTDFNVTQTIVVYDGNNGLEKTEIIAHTMCSAGEADDFYGIQENFEFKQTGNKLPKIILTHKEHGYKPTETYQEGIGNFEYKLTWQWAKNSPWGEPEWNTTFEGNYIFCKELVAEFMQPRYVLSDEYEGYAVLENCQNGGPNFFALSDYSDEYGNSYFILDDNEDDIGTNVLIAIMEQETQYTLVFGRYEKFEANVTGFRHIDEVYTNRYISKRGTGDLENHWGDGVGEGYLFTIDKDKYTYVSCN